MIVLKELIGDLDLASLPADHQSNLLELLAKLNQLRAAWAKPMKITSGYRSKERHLAVYAAKGVTDPAKIPMKSKHLSGQAADVYDPKRELQTWLLTNLSVLESIGLWCEDFSATSNWVHLQTVPPKSGKRFFLP